MVGLPDGKQCACPSGYCSTRPGPTNTVAFEGGKVQFCCGRCKGAFTNATEPFKANARHQMLASGQFKQVKCPLCGGNPSDEHAIEIGGLTVRFCSADCKQKATEAKGQDRVVLLFGQTAFAKGFVAVKN
jgi:hypothetical protein